MVATIEAALGSSRDELDSALAAISHAPRDRAIVLGLVKLLLDRCEFVAPDGAEPETLREVVFRIAAAERKALGPTQRFDRARALELASSELGLASEEVEAQLFADLRKNERLARFRPTTAEKLLDRYDVALAQGVLLRAVRVEVSLTEEEPSLTRQLFRAARFHGLLHRVKPAERGYVIEVDGPMSLFTSSSRYGLALALFLPAVLRCRTFRLAADVLWGKARTPLRFELGPDERLAPHGRAVDGLAPELETFVGAFRELASDWDVAPSIDILSVPGEAVIVPDLAFTNRSTGERIWLEAFGYWSRSAVWQRVETIRRGLESKLILAVGKQLRVSEDVLDESDAAEVYVYRQTMLPKAVLARLERLSS